MNSFVNVQIRVLVGQALAQLAALDRRIAGLEGSFGSATAGSSRFGRSIDGLRLDALGSRIQWIGRQLEYNFTLPVLAAAAASFTLALQNEKAFTRVAKVYGDAGMSAETYAAEIKALEKNFRALSDAYGVNQKETIEIAAQWAAAGASGLALAKSVELTMQAMVLGELEAAKATESLIAIQAQYNLSSEELIKTLAILNMVENQTGISMAGLIEGFSRAAGVARSAGVDVRHLAAMLAALTPAAGSASQAGNALKTIFSRLLAPTQETVEVLGLMGINVADLAWKSSNMVQRLAIMTDAFEELDDAQKNVVASVVASRWQINKFEILMRELSNSQGYYQKALDSTADSTFVYMQMQKELNTVLASNPRRLQIIWTMLQNAAADIIQPMIPLLLHFATALMKLTQWFSNLSPGVQKLVMALLLFLAVVGPLIRYVGAITLLFAELARGVLFLATPVLWAWTKMWLGIQAVTLMGARVTGVIWRTMLASILLFTRAFWVRMAQMFAAFFTAGLLPMLRRVGVAIFAAMTGPWGIALGAIIIVLMTFWDQLKGLFRAMVSGIAAAWNALPQAIRDALMAVVNIVRAAVMRVYELMSYLNPWARHSPSLVDNVTTGVEEIIKQYSRLTNVGTIFARAGVSLRRFGEAMVTLATLARGNELAQLREDIASVASHALDEFDVLVSVLNSLNVELNEVKSRLPVDEMDAMADAIFENDMNIKRLKLHMMELEDAVGPLDELKRKIDDINGAIELAAGERNALRDAGAGSEILSQYDDQLAALEQQRAAIEGQVAPIQEVADQIESLNRAAERLNLEQSLAFDPLTRQVDELEQAIRGVEQALKDMATAAQAAGGSGHRLSPGAQNFLDAEGGNFGDVGGLGREGGIGDQASLIDEFTRELADATSNMFGAFDFLEPVKRGWNKAMDWLRANLGPAWDAFKTEFGKVWSGIPNPLEGISFDRFIEITGDALGGIVSFFEDVWTLVEPPLREFMEFLQGAFGDAFKDIGAELSKFKDLVEPLGELFGQLWDMLQPIVAILGGVLLAAISVLAHVIKDVLVVAINLIIEVVTAFIKILRGLIEFIVGVLTGDWEMAWTGIKDFFVGIWDLIFGVVRGALGLIWGLIKGIGEGLRAFWDLLWTKIGDTVKGAWDRVVSAVITAGTNVRNFFVGLGNSIWGTIQTMWGHFTWFIGQITSLPGRIGAAASGMFNGIWNAFRSAVNGIIGGWNRLQFTIGGGSVFGQQLPSFTLHTPDIPYLERGGFITNGAMAVVGEGRRGFPEYVIPTDPHHRQQALRLFAELGESLGLTDAFGGATLMRTLNQATAAGGRMRALSGKVRRGAYANSGASVKVHNDRRTINFYGDLSFPNVKDGDDAEEFMRNLEALMDEA